MCIYVCILTYGSLSYAMGACRMKDWVLAQACGLCIYIYMYAMCMYIPRGGRVDVLMIAVRYMYYVRFNARDTLWGPQLDFILFLRSKVLILF